MKRRRWAVYAMTMCMVLACSGCGEQKNDNSGTNETVIVGDDMKEYSSGSSETDSSTAEGSSDIMVTDDDSVGGVARTLNIPQSADIDIPAENCGTVESACIKTDKIKTPDADKMYVKKFTMGKVGAEDRETILKSIFDEKDGVYVYPYDLKEDVSQEQRDAIFADKGAEVDYSNDYFIGKINDVEYILYFYDQSWSTDEGFTIKMASDKEIPEDMQKLGANLVTYSIYDSEEIENTNRNSILWQASEEENKCKLDTDQALAKAMDYMAEWGFGDVACTEENDIYRSYGVYDVNNGYEACGYEKNGYYVTFAAAVAGQAIYQPEAFGVDTISHQSIDNNSFDPGNYYYLERSEYSIMFDSDGLVSFTCTWPMKSVGEVTDAGELISWDEAVESLKKCMPEHFADYTGYNKVEFNDVRLSYFRIKTGDGEYEAIPVYAFAQIDGERGSDDWYPIQLVMIDARDGSEVSIVQDESRFGKN